jgi:hypothetical protein
MTPPTLRLVIDLDPMAEPITGTLSSADGPALAFRGWLALTEAVEASRRAAQAASPGEHPTPVIAE